MSEQPTSMDGTAARKSMLRFITCGSVDDGKSTLIGRLLYEAKGLFDDQLAAVAADSKRWGTQGSAVDLALLVDGLSAEREQGITIDVAYRSFSTERRKFVVADTPGHEQYTRNMVTGASTADVAVILIDARRGILEQSRRHSYLCALMGMKNVALAVNKMDLVGWSRPVFDDIVAKYRELATQLGLSAVTPIPVSALHGDNVLEHGANMPWYRGPTLMDYLESAPSAEEASELFRLPVQWVNRPNLDFRGFSGNIVSGCIRQGERVRVQPSGRESTVERVITPQGDAPMAVAGQAVTLTLRDEIDISRGDVLSRADAPAEVADQFQATLVWMTDAPLLPGRPYVLKLGPQTVTATVTDLKYKVSVNTLEHLAATTLGLNDIGVCTLSLDRPVPFDSYATLRATGGFIFCDRTSNATCAAGMLHFALRRAHNIHRQALDVDKTARAALKVQRPCVLWFTGLSGAGKSTIANVVEKKLFASGRHTYLLDGDNVRHGLNRDLGFTDADRVENIRRAAEVAKLMVDAGLIVLAAFISPFQADRAMARALFAPGEFVEIYVDTPLGVAEQRDAKGLYRKARRGELRNFTGVDSPYEAPEAAEIVVGTVDHTPEAAAERVLGRLVELGLI